MRIDKRILKTIAAVIVLALLVESRAYAGYADASAAKQLIDDYFGHQQDGNSVAALIQKGKIVRALYEEYDKAAYAEALAHLQSFAHLQPDATLALADAIQAHWDSHYLQSYLRSYASDYGKLKFLSALSMGVGGIGLLKNPFLHHALVISNMHVLLPLAGGAGAYYLLTLYNKDKSDIPADPQSILQLSLGSGYFSYEEKKHDYLRRLLGVGTGLAGGKLIYQTLAGHFAGTAGKGQRKVTLVSEHTLPAADHTKNYPEVRLPRGKAVKLPQPTSGKTIQRYKSMFRRPFRKSDFTVIIGALLSYYAIEKATYFTLHNMTVMHTKSQLKDAIYKLRSAVSTSNDKEIISAAKQVSDLTIQLVTVQEIKHLHSIASYERELMKPANELAQIGSEVTSKLIALSEKLPTLKGKQPNTDANTDDSQQDEQQVMQDVVAGKLANGIGLFLQVGQVYSVLAKEVSYLGYYRDRMLAKHTHLISMYQKVADIKQQSMHWKDKFSTEELQAAVDVYLKYYHADTNDSAGALPQRGGQQQKIMTSTRAFARFLGEYIANSDIKIYNSVILHILSLYEIQPIHRPALATLIEDIDDFADIQKTSFIIKGVEGAAIGAGLLLATRMIGGLANELGMLQNAHRLRSYLNPHAHISKHFKHLGIAAAAGSTVGIAWHLLKSIAKSKLPAQDSLFEVQKIIVHNMAFNTCILLHDVKADDDSHYGQMTAAEIQIERKKISSHVDRLNTMVSQANHLSSVSPQLRVAQPIKQPIQLPSPHAECSSNSIKAASITPLADDLKTVKNIVSLRLRKLNTIEKKRANAESARETESKREES